jgi:hypothetical protein
MDNEMSFDYDEYDMYNLKKTTYNKKRSTIRSYPQRNKLLKDGNYSLRFFKDQSDLDRYQNICFNKDTQSKKIHYYVEDTHDAKSVLIKDVKYIRNFAKDVYEDKINGFNLNHLSQRLTNDSLRIYDDGHDMTYQELSNFLRCKVIVNKNLKFDFDVVMGHSDDSKYYRCGFGRADVKNYSQCGFSNEVQRENPLNLTYFIPENALINDKINEYIVMITPPLAKENYQYSTQMKIAYPYNEICKHCWSSNGKIWMLKGIGFKSLKKNKGMCKRRNAKDDMIQDIVV